MPRFPLAVGAGVGRGLRGPTIRGALQFGEELARQQNLGDRRGLLKGVLLVATRVLAAVGTLGPLLPERTEDLGTRGLVLESFLLDACGTLLLEELAGDLGLLAARRGSGVGSPSGSASSAAVGASTGPGVVVKPSAR